MQRVAIRPTHSAPQPISTCSEASLIILYPPLAFAARAAAPSVAHLIITAAVERGAPTCAIHSGSQLLDSVVAALSLSPSPFASLLPSLPLPQLLQQSALPVLMCCWPTPVAARIEEAQQLMGATRVRAPGVLIPLRVFKLFSMIVGSMQVRSSSASRRSPCASPLLRPFSSVAHQTCHS